MKSFFSSPLGLLCFSICLALFLPALMMDGMFMDATQYTAVGHNMANGLGSFWYPYFTHGYRDIMEGYNFHEQPPLGFGIFAVVFGIFGDSLYVERFYVLFTYLITIWLIARFWKLICPKQSNLAWVPIFFYSIIPVIFWTFQHNMMENTMGIFIMAGAIAAYKGMEQSRRSVLWVLLAGAFLFLAFMVKGIPGVFPWAVPFLYWVAYRNISFGKVLWSTLLMIATSMGLLGTLFLFPESAGSMKFYLFERVFNRIGSDPTVDSRLFIIWDFLQQMILPVVLLILALGIFKVKLKRWSSFEKGNFWFMLLLGFCGVLPITLTMVQRGFYVTPAYPFIAMALGVLMAEPLALLSQNIKNRSSVHNTLKMAALVILSATLIATFLLAGKPKRHEDLLHDVYAIGNAIGEGHRIGTQKEIMTANWGAKSYFMRYYFIEFVPVYFSEEDADTEYVLLYQDKEVSLPDYKKMDLGLRQFKLYKRNG